MSYKDYEMKIGDLEEQIEELEKENKKYREAIRIAYGKVESWEISNPNVKSYRLCVAFDELKEALNK